MGVQEPNDGGKELVKGKRFWQEGRVRLTRSNLTGGRGTFVERNKRKKTRQTDEAGSLNEGGKREG